MSLFRRDENNRVRVEAVTTLHTLLASEYSGLEANELDLGALVDLILKEYNCGKC